MSLPDKPKFFYKSVPVLAQEGGGDGTGYASCAEAVRDVDDPYNLRGVLVPAADIADAAALVGADVAFGATENRYKIIGLTKSMTELAVDYGEPDQKWPTSSVVVSGLIYIYCQAGALVRYDPSVDSVTGYVAAASDEAATFGNICADETGNYLYVHLNMNPGRVVKYGVNPLRRISAYDFESGERSATTPCGVAAVGGYVYATITAPATGIIKIASADMSRDSSASLTSSTPAYILPYEGNLLVSHAVTPGKLTKVDPTSLVEVNILTLNAGEGPMYQVKAFGTTYVYAVLGSSPTKIAEIDAISTPMARNAVLTFNAGENTGWSLCFDATYGYIGTYVIANAQVLKFNPAAMTRTGALTLNANEEYAYSIESDGTNVYANCYYALGNAGYIVKCSPNGAGAPTRTSAVTLSRGVVSANSCCQLGGYLYVGNNTSPYAVGKFKLPELTFVARLELPSLGGAIDSLIAVGNYIYAGSRDAPAKITKIDPTGGMSIVNTLTLNAGESRCYDMYAIGSKIYCVCSPSGADCIVVEISADNLTRLRSLTLAAGERTCYSIAYDGTYLYLTMSLAPGVVVKVNPSTMARVGALTLNAGENSAYSIVYHSDGCLYASTYTNPSIIVKVDPNGAGAPTRVGAVTLAVGEYYGVKIISYRGYLLVLLLTDPGMVAVVETTGLTELNITLTLDTGESYTNDMLVYNDYLYVPGTAGPVVFLARVNPLAYLSLYERMQDEDIGDSFVIKAAASCAQIVEATPHMLISDNQLSPPAAFATNTEVKLRFHLPNLIADGGFESGAFSPNWTAGANWAIESATELEGAYSASWDLAASNDLQQTSTEKLVKYKTYRVLFKAKSVTANPTAGAILVKVKQTGSGTDLDSDQTGYSPAITTTATWFAFDITADFDTNNWYLLFDADHSKANGATEVTIDEVYVWEKVTVDTLLVGRHNWVGQAGFKVNAWKLSPLRSTATSDANNKTEVASFTAGTSDTIEQALTSSNDPVYEIVLPAVSGWAASIGEVFLGPVWTLPRYLNAPFDYLKRNSDGLREFSVSISNLATSYRPIQVEELFDRIHERKAIWFKFDNNSTPVACMPDAGATEAPYSDHRISVTINMKELP